MQKISNRNFLIMLAFVVGIIGGLAAALLKGLTHFIAATLQNDIDWQYKYSFYLVLPLLGILLSVLYVRKVIKNKKMDHGITPIIYAISRKSSRIEPHNIYSQIVTSAITLVLEDLADWKLLLLIAVRQSGRIRAVFLA